MSIKEPLQGNSESAVDMRFEDNRLLPLLFGERDRYLQRIENSLDVQIQARGNRVAIQGAQKNILVAENVLRQMYDRLLAGQVVSVGEIDACIRLSNPQNNTNKNNKRIQNMPGKSSAVKRLDVPDATVVTDPNNHGALDHSGNDMFISTRRRVITPRSEGQVQYIKQLQSNDLVFGLGPAGIGKTYLATAMAVSALLKGDVDRIIISRPAVEAGEKLGFLPGDLREKVDPYLRPIYDAIFEMLPPDQVERRLESNEIEVAPLAFMRGRTLSRAYVLLDEAQNTTTEQMKMFLTRLGDDSKMIITGDPSQIDLPRGVKSGLIDAMERLEGVEGVSLCRMTPDDVMRHPLVSRIVRAYDK